MEHPAYGRDTTLEAESFDFSDEHFLELLPFVAKLRQLAEWTIDDPMELADGWRELRRCDDAILARLPAEAARHYRVATQVSPVTSRRPRRGYDTTIVEQRAGRFHLEVHRRIATLDQTDRSAS